jgi:hypothetical protein
MMGAAVGSSSLRTRESVFHLMGAVQQMYIAVQLAYAEFIKRIFFQNIPDICSRNSAVLSMMSIIQVS